MHGLRKSKRSVSYFDYKSIQHRSEGEQGLTVHEQLDVRLDRVDVWPAEGDRALLALPLLRDRGCWSGYGDIQVEVHVQAVRISGSTEQSELALSARRRSA